VTDATDPMLRLANDVRMTAQVLSRRIRFENASEIAPHQFSVLIKVSRTPRTPGELAELEQVSAPSMTRTVNGLVESGYLDRLPHPTDGRQRVLTLTDAGRAVVDRTIHERDDWMLRRLTGLSDADRAVLARTVEILNAVLAE
jgi:DNA-binding MarR family transcriptional regulator